MTQETLNASASIGTIASAIVTAEPVPFEGTDDITLSGEMVSSAKAMAICLDTAEGEVSTYAKAYGQRRAVLQFNRNVAASSLDAADKLAIGHKDLASNSAAKRRLSQWHSRFRTIAEAWDSMGETDKADLLQGRASFLSVYDRLKKAEKEAAKEADKAAKEAADAIANANGETGTDKEADKVPLTLAEVAEALANMYAVASDADKEAAGPALALLIDAINNDGGLIEASDIEEVAPIAVNG